MSPSPVAGTQPVSNTSGTSTQRPHWQESQNPYNAGVQVKFLHLEAEVESLLQQLQAIKKQRTASQQVSVK